MARWLEYWRNTIYFTHLWRIGANFVVLHVVQQLHEWSHALVSVELILFQLFLRHQVWWLLENVEKTNKDQQSSNKNVNVMISKGLWLHFFCKTCFSLCFSLCVSLSLSLSLSVCLSFYLSVCLSVSLSIPLFVCLSLSLSLSLSIRQLRKKKGRTAV